MLIEGTVRPIFRPELPRLVGTEVCSFIDLGQIVIAGQEVASVRAAMNRVQLAKELIGGLGVFEKIRMK